MFHSFTIETNLVYLVSRATKFR